MRVNQRKFEVVKRTSSTGQSHIYFEGIDDFSIEEIHEVSLLLERIIYINSMVRSNLINELNDNKVML